MKMLGPDGLKSVDKLKLVIDLEYLLRISTLSYVTTKRLSRGNSLVQLPWYLSEKLNTRDEFLCTSTKNVLALSQNIEENVFYCQNIIVCLVCSFITYT